MDSRPDYRGCDDREPWERESPHMSTASVARDSVLTVESPSPVLRQHHSPPYGPSPGRDLAGNLLRLYLFPTHHGTTRMGHELYPPENSLYTGHTQEVAQWDISHDLPVPGSSWNNGIRDLHAADRSPPDHGERMYQTDAVQVPWWLRSVSADNSFTSYQTFVSVEGAFPLNTGSLIQQPHPSYDADHFAPTIEPNPSNRFPLSSGFRGPPSTPNQDDDSTAQHPTFGSDLPNTNIYSFSPDIWTNVVPQREYAKARNHGERESITFMVDGRLGILVRDAIERFYVGLEGRDNEALPNQASVMTLRIEWPGYKSWGKKIRLTNWKKSPQRIKVEKLATEVAKCIDRFIQDVHTGKHPDRKECSDEMRVGPGFIDIDRLVLVALDNVSKGSWQPRIGLKPVQAPLCD